MSSLVSKWTFRWILLGSLHTCHRSSVWAIVGLEQRVWQKLSLASETRQRCQHKLSWASSLHWDFPIKIKKYLHPSTSLDPQEAYISPTCLFFTFLGTTHSWTPDPCSDHYCHFCRSASKVSSVSLSPSQANLLYLGSFCQRFGSVE